MFNPALQKNIEELAGEGDSFSKILLALHYLEIEDVSKAENLLNGVEDDLNNSIWYNWAKGKLELAKKNYLSAEVYIKKVLIRNSLFYGAYEPMLIVFKKGNRKDRMENLLKFIDTHLPAYPYIDDLKPFRNWLNGEEEPVAAESAVKTDTIDEIIEGVEKGEISDKIESETKAEEFGAAMAGIFEEGVSDEDKNNGMTNFSVSGKASDLNNEISSPEPGSKTGRKIISKTLGEIYASQGQIDQAIEIFTELVKRNPEDAALVRKLEHLKSLRDGSN
jgi:tetratricopeptide (TPR) repeat protein